MHLNVMPTLITVNVHEPGTSWLILVMGKNSGGSRYQVTYRVGHPPGIQGVAGGGVC
jgi:hypothetical protein